MKNVKAIESDIFVTRKIDLAPIIKGIAEISNAGERVHVLCKDIPNVVQRAAQRAKDKLKEEPKFRFIKDAGSISHTEARQRCLALGYRLPEIYSRTEFEELKIFMKEYRIATAHAGIYFDENDAIYRFYSTGLPSWRAFHTELYHWNNNRPQHLERNSWAKTQDEPNVRFFYSLRGQLLMRFEEGVITRGYFRNNRYRDSFKDTPEIHSPVVCQTKWEGEQVFLVKKSGDIVDYLDRKRG
jgi:hypothetical protein